MIVHTASVYAKMYKLTVLLLINHMFKFERQFVGDHLELY